MTAPDPDAAGDESQLLLDLISDGVLVIDGDGVLRSANQAGRDLLGMDLEAPGKTWSVGWEFLEVDGSAVSPEDDPIRTCRRGGRRVFDRQLRLRRNDHSVLAVTVSCIPHPQTTGAVVVLLRSRSQPSETEEQLTHLHRLQTVSVLAGNIAHDFNNLLTIISCNASTVLSTVSETDPLRRPLEDVQAAADEAAELNRDLTLYRHSTPLRQRRCDLNKVVTEALRLLRHAMPQGVSVSSELESDPLSVWGDPGQLRQAVVGLCLAARDMLTTGGDIRVTAARRSAKAPADSPGNEPQRGELATIRVTD
ncbi:MAG: PAS domain-containing protein, partial [bacterium]|nr:PAS domain-containing protein [bacterium]